MITVMAYMWRRRTWNQVHITVVVLCRVTPKILPLYQSSFTEGPRRSIYSKSPDHRKLSTNLAKSGLESSLAEASYFSRTLPLEDLLEFKLSPTVSRSRASFP